MSNALLAAKTVSKTYLLGKRALEVLRNIDLEVHAGDFLALRGASGAGKSTLLYLLGGLDTPNTGEIWLAGRNLATLSRAELARIRNEEVGFIFQAYYLLPELDALENVCLPGRMARKPATALERRGKELLERVGLKDRIEHKPYELSGGEQQRVAIARALINEPDVILADEPTGNLHSSQGIEIMELFKKLNHEGTTIVMVTHSETNASYAHRIIRLSDGWMEGQPRES